MFRFDFRDKSRIPEIVATDNANYLQRLCPVLKQGKIHPSDVVRLRDAAFCCERGIAPLSASAAHSALAENEDYKRLAHRFGMDGHVIRSGLAAFPTCTAVEYGKNILLFSNDQAGDKALSNFLQKRTTDFFNKKIRPEELRIYKVAPLDEAFRFNLKDCQKVSPDLLKYGICIVRQEMTPTLRNFNRLMNRLPERLPLTGEQEQAVSVLITPPDKAKYPAVAKTIPFKKKEQGIKI